MEIEYKNWNSFEQAEKNKREKQEKSLSYQLIPSPFHHTVNVAWDENDYQIDIATADGMQQYRNIIDRNSQFGVGHIVFEPQNSLRASRYNATDAWGWESGEWSDVMWKCLIVSLCQNATFVACVELNATDAWGWESGEWSNLLLMWHVWLNELS